MKADAVIGANYGDEGKGLITDKICHEVGADLVVRFNGGAQAGHTVCTPDGKRFVFHHIGAGALQGVATFLSRFFICNPSLFNQEFAELQKLTPQIPTIIVDPRCTVTVPWDMILNQLCEENGSRHGSCGVGINETVERNLDPAYKLTVKDLITKSQGELAAKVKHIKDNYFQARLREMRLETRGLGLPTDDAVHYWVKEASAFLEKVLLIEQYIVKNYSQVVFEGAQGLALSQDNWADFPHLTRSYTGVRNVMRLCEELEIEELDVTYVTRSYLTRHGNGPLPGEEYPLTFSPKDDRTNVDHPYQGSIRYALLEPEALASRIYNDITLTTVRVKNALAITHLDTQEGELAMFTKGSGSRISTQLTPEAFTHRLKHQMPFLSGGVRYLGTGPTRNDVLNGEKI